MDDRIADLIAACRTPEVSARLALPDRGGRAVPVASEWLRRWGPKPVAPLAAECACAAGRCSVCN